MLLSDRFHPDEFALKYRTAVVDLAGGGARTYSYDDLDAMANGVARGLLVALAITLGLWAATGLTPAHPLTLLVFVTLGAAFLSALGMLAGLWAMKFDQMAAITNFLVTPLAFLSGTFYSVEALPPVLRAISHANPVFYLIDGVRYGMIGTSDSPPLLGLMVCSGVLLAICLLAWSMLRSGYRLKA